MEYCGGGSMQDIYHSKYILRHMGTHLCFPGNFSKRHNFLDILLAACTT